MSRSARIWILLGLLLALSLGAMVWITRATLRAENEALQQDNLQQRLRLAQRRMDSTLAPVVPIESARPYFHFNAFYPADRAFNRMFTKIEAGGILIPSPLLLAEEPHILLHFQVDPGDHFSSPMVPPRELRGLAVEAGADLERIHTAAQRLEDIQKTLSGAEIRTRMFQQGAMLQTLEQIRSQRPAKLKGAASRGFVSQSPFTPFWCGEHLLLARQVWVGDQEYLQGCWLDWPAIRLALLSSVLDILPQADLVSQDDAHAKGRALSVLPLRLVPGVIPVARANPRSPVRIALLFGWSCALFAGLAGILVLFRTLQLSERRGTFVSAVTHELRTPLTTFRLYTEMLAMGMVPDEEERQSFLKTLLAEADRLDHLVKNVLSFARLESRRSFANLERIALEDLLDRQSGRLFQRSQQGGMSLEIEVPEDLRRLQVLTDPSVVEQILFNLVDNACKYAVGDDRSLRFSALRQDGFALLRCCDKGPGIAPEDRKNLFRPFSKSAQKAARSAPGVGLGLALCRRLARSLGGDLVFDATVQDGACFVLKLPVATEHG